MAPSSFFLKALVPLILCATTIESKQVDAYFPRSAAYSSQEQAAKIVEHGKIPYKTNYFLQILDHFTFRPESSKIFYQKYLINIKYWHKGAPIFVYTSNEGDIEWSLEYVSNWSRLAIISVGKLLSRSRLWYLLMLFKDRT
ncbi:hypothetical protein POM88_053918 [Heracleum sosnowskyi]|uniref:Uncharacterized protein n=1 Tax=Heracleum sosnowskyi TaxID=360622 RepID=A0AAD8GPT1_9APIA|nr:hypothetical protein POM88_053918 [Heracleum sosnowskyi]